MDQVRPQDPPWHPTTRI